MAQHLYMEKNAGKSIWFCILFVKLPSYMLYFICLTYQMSVETESNCNVLYLYMYMVQSGPGVGNCFIVEGGISFNSTVTPVVGHDGSITLVVIE